MQMYGGVEVYFQGFLTLAVDGGKLLFHALACLSSREQPWYSLNRRLRGPQSRSGHNGKKKNSALPGIGSQSSNPQPSHYTKLIWLLVGKYISFKMFLSDIVAFQMEPRLE
jgi:hypothetical protein